MAKVTSSNDIRELNDACLDKHECAETHAMVQLAMDICTLVPGGVMPPRYPFHRLYYTMLQVAYFSWGSSPFVDPHRRHLFASYLFKAQATWHHTSIEQQVLFVHCPSRG